MSTGLVALCRDRPDLAAEMDALLAAGPDLLVRPWGPVVQLLDGTEHVVASVDGPLLVQVPGEVRRLLGVESVAEPVWWVEVRPAAAHPDGHTVARRVAEHLAGAAGGVLWPAR